MEAHDERLRVPLWWWLLGLCLGALAGAEVHQGAPGLRSWLPYSIALPLVVVFLWWVGRLRIRVDATELHVDDAHLPLSLVREVRALDGPEKRSALGAELAPLAFVVSRPWVPGAVKVTLDDPADPTPYWIVSSRRPAQLVAAIATATGGPGTGPTTTGNTRPA